jgi:hypothetical protein
MRQVHRQQEEGKPDEDGMVLPTDISQEFCEALSVLSHAFLITSQNLAQSLFQTIIKSTCSRAEDRIISNVILTHQFTLGGAQQLELDITMGLWQGVYRRWLRKPPLHFKKLKEALFLLNLPTVTIEGIPSLDKTLEQIDFIEQDESLDAMQLLQSLGISRLEFETTADIVKRRI